MEDSITIVVSSKHNHEEKEDFIKNVVNTCGCVAHVIFMVNKDGVSLTKLYNEMLHSEKCEDDIIVFIHDDVEFLKEGWGNEIIRLFNDNKEYGIIGVAGSAQFDENAAWWNYEKKYGQVLHRHEGKSWLTRFSPLLDKDLEEVCVIDGLFIGVNKKRITKEFDENVKGFNFYDIDFCLANYIDGKTKIGVTTNIRLAHNSIGETKQEWFVNREQVNEKYKENYPINIKK